jgi:hypothetical protein
MLVVVVAVVMWESPQRFPRAVGRVGKQFYRFPTLSTDRHFHRLVFCALDFSLSAFCSFLMFFGSETTLFRSR